MIDTNVISEARKGRQSSRGVKAFSRQVERDGTPVYISVVTIGELRRGIEKIRHRTDFEQAQKLERWLNGILADYADNILDFDRDTAQVWGRLRVPNHENALDKQIAATALIHDLIIVTRNVGDFRECSVRLFNPFQ
ncbi:MAG: type II toxin-antitoxin system VapC family toxin [Gammaproteobacteria bacterium]|nr:type II toxin-antitoxin system VapC family toxin [Gammaproteobacteria bacterium]